MIENASFVWTYASRWTWIISWFFGHVFWREKQCGVSSGEETTWSKSNESVGGTVFTCVYQCLRNKDGRHGARTGEEELHFPI